MFTFVALLARRLAGLTCLVAFIAGVPYALVRYVGRPLPDHLPTWREAGAALASPLTDAMLGNTLVCALWAAWAAFAWSVLTEVAELFGMVRLPRPRAFAPARGLATLLIAMVTGGLLATTAHAANPPPRTVEVVSTAPVDRTAAAPVVDGLPPGPDGPAAGAPAVAPTLVPVGHVTLTAAGQEYTYRVLKGDTLSAIAQAWLGDADRWPEIFALNRGTHYTAVGGTMTDPNLIYPGWSLELPDDAVPPAGTAQAPPTSAGPGELPAEPPMSGPHSGETGPAVQPTTTDTVPPAEPDGVVEPPSATATAPTPSAARPTTTDRSQAPEPGDGSRAAGVDLPSGSWIDLAMGTAIVAAAALVWANRRRRYVPRPPSPDPRIDDPDLAPLPPVVAQIRRGMRPPAPGTDDEAEEPGNGFDGVADEARPDGPAPRRAIPAFSSMVWPSAGLGLTGPGAQAAARGLLAAALAAGGVDTPTDRSTVVISAATAAGLLDTDRADLPESPRLTVTADLEEALDLLDTHVLHRTRLVYRHEVDDLAALREIDPLEEPTPPILLIAGTPQRHERARIAALLTQGRRLDIRGVVLGPWPDGDTVAVAEDGTSDDASFTVLTAVETVDLIRTLAESHTGLPQLMPSDVALTSSRPAPAAEFLTDDLDAREATDVVEPGEDDSATPEPRTAPVNILGTIEMVDADPRRNPRRKSLELLVYLAINDGTATAEAILDDVLPDAPASKAAHRLHTYVSDLRTVLRHNYGPGTYLTRSSHRYHLNRDTVDVDLWRMRSALAEAANAPTTTARIAALRAAVAEYRGPLADDGSDYEWAEPYREAVRRQALDAFAALADALSDRPAEQITVLNDAISHNPYTETLYQAAMRAHAALGHLDAVRNLRRSLTRRLAEIDAEPADDSLRLADDLVARLQRTSHPLAATRSGDEAA